MATFCNEVVLCKGLSESASQEEYGQCLESAGYRCKLLSALSFNFINIELLRERLMQPDSYSGVILTSPRSVEAIRSAGGFESWRKIPGYCVGSGTESLAKNSLGFDECFGADSGNSRELAKYILEKTQPDDKPLLYPCSAIARDTVQQILESNSRKIDKLIVYQTLPSKSLKDDLYKIVSEASQIFVFFSPSIVEYITNAAAEVSVSLKNIKPVAIGPVTEDALRKFQLPVYATATKPEPHSLLQAIKTIKNISTDNSLFQ